jgi:hypothetical protein
LFLISLSNNSNLNTSSNFYLNSTLAFPAPENDNMSTISAALSSVKGKAEGILIDKITESGKVVFLIVSEIV